MLSLIKSSAALFLAKALLLGTRIVALLALARYGRQDELAGASYAIALAEVFRLFADWGTDTWAIRAFALTPATCDRARLVTSAFCVKVSGGVLLGLVALCLCIARFPANGMALGLLAMALILSSQIAGLAISYFQALNRVRKIAILMIPCLITIAAAPMAIVMTGSAGLLLMVLGAGELFTAAILIWLLYREKALDLAVASSAGLRQVVRESTPAALFGLIIGVYSRLDTLVLAQVSTAALATYTVANRLFLPFQVAVTTLGSIIYSTTASALSANRRTPETFYLRELPLTFLVSALLGLLLWLAGGWLIRDYLPGFEDAVAVLRILCILLAILGLSSAVAARALAYGRVMPIATIAALDLICTGIAMGFMVPTEGATGAARALLLGACVNLCVTLAYAFIAIERPGSFPVPRTR